MVVGGIGHLKKIHDSTSCFNIYIYLFPKEKIKKKYANSTTLTCEMYFKEKISPSVTTVLHLVQQNKIQQKKIIITSTFLFHAKIVVPNSVFEGSVSHKTVRIIRTVSQKTQTLQFCFTLFISLFAHFYPCLSRTR